MRESAYCVGCGDPISRGSSWCERCRGASAHLSSLRSAARILRLYSADSAAQSVEHAVDAILEQLRTGDGCAREVAAATEARLRARDEGRAAYYRREARERPFAIALEELVSEAQDRPPVAAPIADWIFGWLRDFVGSLADDELDRDPRELVARAIAYVGEQERLLIERGCTCGHRTPHPEESGCVCKGCGCLSPARLARAARALPSAAWTIDDFRKAWPALG